MMSGWTDWAIMAATALASGFGLGYVPLIPGTVGTLLALPIYDHLLTPFSPKARWIRLALGFGAGIVLCGMVSNALNQPDPACIVLDEIIAFLMVLCVTPRCWQWRTIAFLIFRWFDIIKPIPINWIDTVIPGGFGIMLDDGVAAGYTIMILLLAKRLRQASR